MKKKTTRPCRRRECGKEIPYTLEPYCSFECKKLDGAVSPSKPRTPIKSSTQAIQRTPLKRNTTPIPKRSKKGQKLDRRYAIVRLQVLTDAKFKCFVDGCTRTADTCEHQRGRVGYFDEWARENDIPLLIDKRFLKPCCSFHNLEFERDPELSKQYQLSRHHHGTKGEHKI